MSVGSIGWRTAYEAAKGYAKRAAKMYPEFVFGTGNDAFAKAMKSTIKNRATTGDSYVRSIGKGFKDGILAAEKHNKTLIATKGGFWKNFKHNISTVHTQIAKGWKVGGQRAASLGKNVTKGKILGAFKGLGTRMPVIGSVLLALSAVPDIFKATKNEGIVSGGAEVVKAGARIGGATLGAAIGSAALGPIGGFVGWFVGDWVAKKVVGKNYTERQLDAEAKIAEAQAQATQQAAQTTQANQQIPGMNMTQADFINLQKALYGTNGNIFEQDALYRMPQFNQATTPKA